MPARYGRDRGKKSLLERIGLARKKSGPGDNEEAQRAELFNRPKGQKSHSWLTWVWVGAIVLGIAIVFAVLYYVLIAPQQAVGNNLQPQSALPVSISNVLARIGQAFFIKKCRSG